jgi:hypothetical protein
MSTSSNTVNIGHIQRLNGLKDAIEAMSKVHHPDVLRILDKSGIPGSENKNGTFVNLTSASESVIAELEAYIEYVKDQEKELSEVEDQKRELATKYFTTLRSNPNTKK